MLKTIWNAMGDTRIAVVLLMLASATLLTGALHAEGHFSFFMELNHIRIQDWLPVRWASRPDLVWWIAPLFIVMGLLGINTFICASNRCLLLISQRNSLTPKRFFYLMIPSLVHFLFIIVMLGHLATFMAGKWETVPLTAGEQIRMPGKMPACRVEAVEDRFFPANSVLHDRLRQTAVTLVLADRKDIRLQYAGPVFIDGRFLLLDKAPKADRGDKGRPPAATPPAAGRQGLASAEAVSGRGPKTDRPSLLIVSDPGLGVIILGLTSIMGLMIVYFILKPKLTRGYDGSFQSSHEVREKQE